MKRVIVNINDSGVDWKANKRILLRTELGIMIGTVKTLVKGKLDVKLDNGGRASLSIKSPSILGEGLNRKRKSIIPDDELYAWKRELCAESLGR